MIENDIREALRQIQELHKKFDELLAVKTAPPEKEKRLATVNAAARKLDVCRQTVYRLVESGEIKGIRFGKTLRIDLGSIDRLMNKQKAS